MYQVSSFARLNARFSEEFRLLIRSSYWRYIDGKSRERVLTLLAECRDWDQRAQANMHRSQPAACSDERKERAHG
jgi:hypothetical protein